ncbi:MAG: sensor domain-containing diguanylate cyclase [Gemmatimonadota bacterium]|nr:sensor domain-containing diguanylate cyclase [Gemmatimonadota bacterium]
MSGREPADRTEQVTPPIPPDEPDRLETLEQYDILDTAPEQAYDDLTLLASEMCDAPIALVSFVDSERQWFKSRIGLEVAETPRDVAFCAHAVASQETLIVPDAMQDKRFADNPLVTDEPQIRFYAGAPLITPDGHALGTLCVIDRKPRTLTAKQQQALEALSRQVVSQLELRRKVADLHKFSIRDPLTGVFNRGYFDSLLPRELERAKRYHAATSLLLVDVDRFKHINDAHGHQEGDRVLTLLSGILSRSVRAADTVCRYGGEEFAVILPHTDLEVAASLAERIRTQVATESAAAEVSLKVERITVTVGVTTFPTEASDASELVAVADRRLYQGKTAGRDRVVASDTER